MFATAFTGSGPGSPEPPGEPVAASAAATMDGCIKRIGNLLCNGLVTGLSGGNAVRLRCNPRRRNRWKAAALSQEALPGHMARLQLLPLSVAELHDSRRNLVDLLRYTSLANDLELNDKLAKSYGADLKRRSRMTKSWRSSARPR